MTDDRHSNSEVGSRYPDVAPRLWHGIRLGDYVKLLWQHRFRVSPSRWHLAALTVPISALSSILTWLQWLLYRSKLADVTLEPPLFIVGHFRTGTTHLLELLANDPQFTYPTTYESLGPTHFLISQTWVAPLVSLLAPRKRPMDNMAAGMERPQEDEFALIALGGPTPYRRMLFPNEATPHIGALNSDTMSSTQATSLREKLVKFYRAITLRRPGRLLIKSPAHTGRISWLASLFPGAKFVHISRDPRCMMPSLRQAWKILDVTQGLQAPSNDLQYEEVMLEMFDRMYAGFESHINDLPAGSFAEMRYEDLVRDPMAQLSRIYRELDLGDFAAVRSLFSTYQTSQADYRTNDLPPETSLQNVSRVKWYCQRYGYEVGSA